MNDKSLEERTIYDGPKNNERVNIVKALERLYGCILNKKKNKMKFIVRYEKKETHGYPFDRSLHYYADLFVYKENFKGKFAQLIISRKKLGKLKGELGIEIRPHSEKRYKYKYGKLMWDGYLDFNSMQHYFSEITITTPERTPLETNIEFTLKREPFETNTEIKERKTKERLAGIRQQEEEGKRALYESCMSKSRLG